MIERLPEDVRTGKVKMVDIEGFEGFMGSLKMVENDE